LQSRPSELLPVSFEWGLPLGEHQHQLQLQLQDTIADVAFHLHVAKAAQNSILEQMLVSIQSLLRSWITRVRDASTGHGPSCRDHVPIHAAIEKGDVAAAREAMHSHLTNAGERLKQASLGHPVKD
jgi:DNA-binding FadR family transcriptional regulator